MALKSNPVTLGATDTVIYQAPVDAGAVVQPYVANVHATLTRTYQLRLFKQSTGLTTTLGPPSAPLAALAPLAKIPLAVSMEAGDRLIGVASAASSIVVTPFIDISRSSVAKGFNPRGVWAIGTTYAENDVVYLASTGSSYISLQDVNVGNSPDTSPAWWMVSAAQGVAGNAGVAGASSLQIVRVVSTGPAGPTADFESGDIIDGVTLATNDLVFRNSTASPELNGVYVAAASGAAARHSEYDTYNEHPGRVFSVTEGTTYADTLWQCTSNPGGVLGTNPLTFATILDAAVAISGDTMTGALVLPGDPTLALQAAPKQYVDAHDARRNRIVNGAFQISQENGGTVLTASGSFISDQWMFAHAGVATVNANRQGPYVGAGYFIAMAVGTPKTSIAGTEHALFIQTMEDQNIIDFYLGTASSKQFFLTFDINVPVAGTYWVSFYIGTHSYLASYIIAAGEIANWVRKQIVVPAGAINAGTWFTSANNGTMAVRFAFHTGTTLVGVAGLQTGNFTAGPGAALGLSTVNACYLANVGLYLDVDNTGVPPKWEMPDPVQELATCQRYWQKTYSYGDVPGATSASGAIIGTATGTTGRPFLTWTYPTRLRSAAPTVTFYNPVTGAAGTAQDLNTSSTLGTVTLFFVSDTASIGYVNVAPALGDAITVHMTVNARL